MDPEHWHITLNKYQRDNLITLLMDYIGWGGQDKGIEPFNLAHTGDWTGEIAQKLDPAISAKPNVTKGEMEERFRMWLNYLAVSENDD